MSERVLNTGMETQYRMLLLLSLLPREGYTSRWLSAMDFIIVYGQTFGLTDQNLHGNNLMKFTEYATRGWNIDEGLKNLAFRRWVTVDAGEDGFRYSVTDQGMKVAEMLETNYAREYRLAAGRAIEQYGQDEENALDEMIRNLPSVLADQEERHG